MACIMCMHACRARRELVLVEARDDEVQLSPADACIKIRLVQATKRLGERGDRMAAWHYLWGLRRGKFI
jgi:hypothetical protein